MPDVEFKQLDYKEFKQLTDKEKALYRLQQPVKLPSDSSLGKWRECLERAAISSSVGKTRNFWEIARDKACKELEKAAADIGEDFADVSEYTGNGSFDAAKFIADKKRCKITWDGHIIGAEDVELARQELAKGSSNAAVHDMILSRQKERLKAWTQRQADRMNSRPGKSGRVCPMCMGRGYNAVVENDVYIALRICSCQKAREQATDKARQEQQKERKSRK